MQLYLAVSLVLVSSVVAAPTAALEEEFRYLITDTVYNTTAQALDARAPPVCLLHWGKRVTSAVQETGWTFPVAGSGCIASSTNCQISAGKTYSVGKTVTVGGGLDGGLGELIKAAVGASFSASYSWSETHADSVTVSATCPKHHECQLQVTPQMLHVKGYQTQLSCNNKIEVGEKKYFEVFYPVQLIGSTKDSEAVVMYSACTVGKKESKGYPSCPPAGGEPRPADCDPIGAKAADEPFRPTCR